MVTTWPVEPSGPYPGQCSTQILKLVTKSFLKPLAKILYTHKMETLFWDETRDSEIEERYVT